jgi:DNA (cytosine-5)-methyltransferase 1
MRFGSVCSGIEAASVAWEPLGWKAAWLSEIEPFPSAVLKHHYPDVPNLGDMTQLRDRIASGEVEAPDLFCGGTPCQAFSVAGLRKSLDDARGNLSLVFCEIANAIDNVRATGGQPPSIIFWENVPGVLSTKDNAFGCFLAGLAGEDDPVEAPGGKWSNAGCVFGPQRAVAWRVLDAQYFGVAQRRRRVFVVASARDGFDPAAVLFEFDGVRRDSAPSRETGKVAPTIPARSTAGGGLGTDFDCDGGVITMAHGQGGAEIGIDRGPTLTCNHEAPIAVYQQPIAWDEELNPFVDVAGTLLRGGAGGRHDGVAQPVAFVQNSRDEVRLMGGDGSLVGALAAETGAKQQCYVAQPVDRQQIEQAQRERMAARFAGRKTKPATADFDFAAPNDAIAFHPTQDPISSVDGSTHALGCGSSEGQASVAVAFGGMSPVAGTLTANTGGMTRPAGNANELDFCVPVQSMQVRRLTPVECERLQGFPDNYTAIPWRKKPASECPDGPRYKALGNSWAVPVVRWIGNRIHRAVSI